MFLPALLFALTFHEAAHAWMSLRLGDPTARILGRLTLNPLAHLDLFGTLSVLLIGFGWAKPVPFDPRNFQNPRRDILLTAAAGPISNLILATLSALVFRYLLDQGWGTSMIDGFWHSIGRIVGLSLIINLQLAFFNLIPLPPLDGSKILSGIVPKSWDRYLWRLEQIGPMVLFGLIMVGMFMRFSVFWLIIGPPVSLACYYLSGLPFGYLSALIFH
jgi:Zn-dependent protease